MGDREELVESIVEQLRVDGAPAGTWLVEIEQARRALQRADSLLRRLADAIVEQQAQEVF